MSGCGTTSSHYLNNAYGKDEFRTGPVGLIALRGIDVKYVIWDCQEDRAVSYGIYEDSMHASFFFTQGEWLNLMKKASGSLIRYSPLR